MIGKIRKLGRPKEIISSDTNLKSIDSEVKTPSKDDSSADELIQLTNKSSDDFGIVELKKFSINMTLDNALFDGITEKVEPKILSWSAPSTQSDDAKRHQSVPRRSVGLNFSDDTFSLTGDQAKLIENDTLIVSLSKVSVKETIEFVDSLSLEMLQCNGDLQSPSTSKRLTRKRPSVFLDELKAKQNMEFDKQRWFSEAFVLVNKCQSVTQDQMDEIEAVATENEIPVETNNSIESPIHNQPDLSVDETISIIPKLAYANHAVKSLSIDENNSLGKTINVVSGVKAHKVEKKTKSPVKLISLSRKSNGSPIKVLDFVAGKTAIKQKTKSLKATEVAGKAPGSPKKTIAKVDFEVDEEPLNESALTEPGLIDVIEKKTLKIKEEQIKNNDSAAKLIERFTSAATLNDNHIECDDNELVVQDSVAPAQTTEKILSYVDTEEVTATSVECSNIEEEIQAVPNHETKNQEELNLILPKPDDPGHAQLIESQTFDENEAPSSIPEKKITDIMMQLETTLSPRMTSLTDSDDDCMRVELTRFITKSTPVKSIVSSEVKTPSKDDANVKLPIAGDSSAGELIQLTNKSSDNFDIVELKKFSINMTLDNALFDGITEKVEPKILSWSAPSTQSDDAKRHQSVPRRSVGLNFSDDTFSLDTGDQAKLIENDTLIVSLSKVSVKETIEFVDSLSLEMFQCNGDLQSPSTSKRLTRKRPSVFLDELKAKQNMEFDKQRWFSEAFVLVNKCQSVTQDQMDEIEAVATENEIPVETNNSIESPIHNQPDLSVDETISIIPKLACANHAVKSLSIVENNSLGKTINVVSGVKAHKVEKKTKSPVKLISLSRKSNGSPIKVLDFVAGKTAIKQKTKSLKATEVAGKAPSSPKKTIAKVDFEVDEEPLNESALTEPGLIDVIEKKTLKIKEEQIKNNDSAAKLIERFTSAATLNDNHIECDDNELVVQDSVAPAQTTEKILSYVDTEEVTATSVECSNIEEEIQAVQTFDENEAPSSIPEKKITDIMMQLETTLSPRMTSLTDSDDDFMRVELTRFITKSTPVKSIVSSEVKTPSKDDANVKLPIAGDSSAGELIQLTNKSSDNFDIVELKKFSINMTLDNELFDGITEKVEPKILSWSAPSTQSDDAKRHQSVPRRSVGLNFSDDTFSLDTGDQAKLIENDKLIVSLSKVSVKETIEFVDSLSLEMFQCNGDLQSPSTSRRLTRKSPSVFLDELKARFITKSTPVKAKSTQKPDTVVTNENDFEFEIDKVAKDYQRSKLSEPIKNVVETLDLTEPQKISSQTLQLEERPISDVDSARGSSVDLEEQEAKFKSGDILWGRCALHKPFWPCIVCESPDEGIILMKTKLQSKLHVRFFAEKTRFWMIIPRDVQKFEEIQDLEEKILKMGEMDKKMLKSRPDSMPRSQTQIANWEQAILQANEFLTYKIEDRVQAYYALQTKEQSTRLEKVGRRRLSSQSSSVLNLTFNGSPSVGSLQSSTPNNNNQQAEKMIFSENRKRSRSPTPESPPYEELESEEKKQLELMFKQGIERYFQSIQNNKGESPNKKLHMHLVTERNDSRKMLQAIKKQRSNDEIENDEEYQEFFRNLGATVVKSGDSAILSDLKLYSKKIWLLKLLDENKVQMENLSALSQIGSHLDRKLSLRGPRSSSTKSSSIAESQLPLLKPEDKCLPDKPKKREKKQTLTLKELFLSQLDKTYLFKGLPRDPVCQLCRKPDALVKCVGGCHGSFHAACCVKPDMKEDNVEFLRKENKSSRKRKQCEHVSQKKAADEQSLIEAKNRLDGIIPTTEVKAKPADEESLLEKNPDQSLISVDKGQFKCNECLDKWPRKCFVCNNDKNPLDLEEERVKCSVNLCGKFYHITCLQQFPQAIITASSSPSLKNHTLYCPAHCCHTCVSEDPRQKTKSQDKPPLIKCTLCPSSYHFDSTCVPAGSQFLTASQIICPRHSARKDRTNGLNVNWCFICSLGGTLICCEICPTSFHLECLDIAPPTGKYICEECETGRMPLYNEIIWAKYGAHRWWPAIILPPPVIPKLMLRKSHLPYEFCLRFFGSHDFAWIKRERVFLYQDGDSENIKKCDKAGFNDALIESKEIFDFLKEQKKNDSADPSRNYTKPPYTHIKTNRPSPAVKLYYYKVEENAVDICSCQLNDESPCAADSNCLNRTLLTECNPRTCPTGSKCMNQQFKKRDYPKMKVCYTAGRGWGLKTTQKIAEGSFVIEYVGELIDNAELEHRMKSKLERKDENYYFLTINGNVTIDAGLKGNVARFMNHSCEPNCQTEKWTVNGIIRIGLFALRDIEPNTELTFDYNLECAGTVKKKCSCNTKSCSGFIGQKKNKVIVEKIPAKKQRVREPTGSKIETSKALHKEAQTIVSDAASTLIPTSLSIPQAMDLEDGVANVKPVVEHVTGDLLKNVNHITGDKTATDKQLTPDD